MRAVIHHELGEPADVLGVEEVDTPTPGPGEVRLRVLLSPIHNHDLWTVRGTYGYKPELPARAGTEAVGVVEELGEGVEGLTVGQRVATGGTFGVWAEQVVAKAAGLIPVADGLSDEVASQLVSMPFSAISLLHSLDLKAGDWIVQNTANGAVGRMVAQIAKARGIHVIGLVRRQSAVAELAEQGIDNVVSTDVEGWRDAALALADGARIVAGVDSVGGSASNDVLSLLSENGTLVIFGSMGAGKLELSAGDVSASELAGDPIQTLITTAPGNGASIGGLKVATAHGWFAARPSGTEDVYKLYAESFRGIDHLRRIQTEARAIVAKALAGVAR